MCFIYYIFLIIYEFPPPPSSIEFTKYARKNKIWDNEFSGTRQEEEICLDVINQCLQISHISQKYS